jgi:hypothetical protein
MSLLSSVVRRQEKGGRRRAEGGRRKEEGGWRKEEGGGRREEGEGVAAVTAADNKVEDK